MVSLGAGGALNLMTPVASLDAAEPHAHSGDLWGGLLTIAPGVAPALASHAGVPSLAKPRSARLSSTVRGHP